MTRYLIVIGFSIIGWILAAVFMAANSTNRQNFNDISSINRELQDSIRIYKNKNNQLVSEKAAVEAELGLLKDTYADEFRQIKEQLRIQQKDVRGIFKAITESTGSGTGSVDTVYVPGDGPTSLKVNDTTQWFSISGVVTPTSFNYTYTVWDDITLVPFYKGKDLYVRGTSKNPNTRITGLQGILVAKKERPKFWGIGPSVQFGYYGDKWAVVPGVSIQYNLLRF